MRMQFIRLAIVLVGFWILGAAAQAQEVKLVLPVGHTGKIEQAEFTPDGQKIITLSRDDKSIGIWDAKTGFLITKMFQGTLIYGFHVSADSKYLLVIDPNSPKVVDLTSSAIIGEFKEFANDAKYSPDGSLIVSAKLSRTAKVWDAKTLTVKKEFTTSSNNFYDAFFSPLGNYLVTCAVDSIKWWNVKTWELVQGIRNDNNKLVFSPDESKYVIANKDGKIDVVDSKTFKLIRTLKKSSKTYWNMEFSPNGNSLFTSDLLGGPYEMWDIATGTLKFELKQDRGNIMFSKLSPDGKTILTRSTQTQDEAKIWSAEDGKLLAEFMAEKPSNLENYVNYDHTGNQVIAPSATGIKIYDIGSQKLLYQLTGNASRIADFYLNEKYGELAMRTADDKLRLLNMNSLLPMSNKFSAMKSSVIQFMPKQNVLINSYKGSVKFWNIEQQNQLYQIKSDSGIFTHQIDAIAIDRNEKLMAGTSLFDHDISMYYLGKDTIKKKLVGHEQTVNFFKFSNDGKYLISNSWDKTTKVWDVEKSKLLYTLKHDPAIRGATYAIEPVLDNLEPCKLIFLNEKDRVLYVRELQTGKKLFEIKEESSFKDVAFSKDGKLIVTTTSYKPKVWDANNGTLVATLEDYGSQILQFNGADRVAMFAYNELKGTANVLFVADLRTGKTLKKIKLSIYTRPQFIDFARNRCYATDNEQLKIFDLNTGNEIAAAIALNEVDFLNKLPNGYYMATPNAAKLLHYVTNDLNLITFEQLDIKYNRPDKVLSAIGYPDTALINSYQKAYEKRIKKLKIDTTGFTNGYAVPTADFSNRNSIDYKQSKDLLTLNISAKDNQFNLDRFNVWVNEVPVYGMLGISLKNRAKQSIDTIITIKLSAGENRVETSVTNVNGAESYRMPLFVNYHPEQPKKTKIYFVGIGINKFVQKDYNLNYSVKDIRDLTNSLKQKYGTDFVVVDTLFDERVTNENVAKLKAKLLETDVNDKVIIAYSGHGLLNKSYDYFLSTYSVDFDDPTKKGLPYEDLEILLDGIPSRQKLLLIDACHSGEVDKDDLQMIAATEEARTKESVKGVKVKVINKSKKIGIKNSFELMQELFVNVNKSTGATIISAAGGTQYALEKGDLKNGVFTYSILELLKDKPTIKVSELKTAVSERVEELTAGAQKPTSRNENIAVDWNVW